MNTAALPPIDGSSLDVTAPEIVSVLPTPDQSVVSVEFAIGHEPRRFVVLAAGVPDEGVIPNSASISAELKIRDQNRP